MWIIKFENMCSLESREVKCKVKFERFKVNIERITSPYVEPFYGKVPNLIVIWKSLKQVFEPILSIQISSLVTCNLYQVI